MRITTTKSLLLVASLAPLATCSSSTTASPAATSASATTTMTVTTTAGATTSAGSASSPATRTIAVTVTGTKVVPDPATVPLKPGEALTLVLTSDHDDDVHAHGFEVEQQVKAGVPLTMVLKIDAPGVYEVEMHQPALTLMKIAVS